MRYIRYDRHLLEITMLSGPYTGWQFQESSGQMVAAFVAVLGLVCFIGGYRQRHKPVRQSRAAEDGPQWSDVTSHG